MMSNFKVDDNQISEKLYISLCVYSLMYAAIYMLNTGNYAGELSSFQYNVTILEIMVLATYSFLGFIAFYFFYTATLNKKIYFYKIPWLVNDKRLLVVFSILLVVQLIFLIVTGVGRVGSQETSSYSPFFALINIDSLFGIYYFILRKSALVNRKFFWLTIFVYVLFKLLQGWSGILLLIPIFELYFYLREHRFTSIKRMIIIVLAPLLLILSGGKLYEYVYPYKFEIRGLGLVEVNYLESIVNLTNRLTFFPVSVGAYEKQNEIKLLSFQDDTLCREIQGFFRPFAPRFLMEYKEFRSVNNLVIQAFFPGVQASTSSDIGFIMYAVTLFSSNMAEGIIWVVFTIVLLIINKFIIDSFEQFPGQLNFIYFLLIMRLYYTASPEMVFSYGLLGIIFLLPLLFTIGVVKLRKLDK